MIQPDLGKKILELRLAKGFTQDELAEKCNVSLRTIQRIESAKVNPRSYTVKLIFSNLDYDFFDSSKELQNQTKPSADKTLVWLSKAKSQVLELFNLKRNTMKKLGILSLPLIVLGCLLFYSSQGRAQEYDQVKNSIEKSNEKMVKWYNKKDFDSIGSLYMENAMVTTADGSELTGRQNIVDDYLINYQKGFRALELEIEKLIVSADIAVEIGAFRIKMKDVVYKGKYQVQWRYYNKEWLIENEISTMKYYLVDK